MEWALNAATLSQYYINKGLYMEGRQRLSAATVISLAGEVREGAGTGAEQEPAEAEEGRRRPLPQPAAGCKERPGGQH